MQRILMTGAAEGNPRTMIRPHFPDMANGGRDIGIETIIRKRAAGQ
jgi:hypothetical protein